MSTVPRRLTFGAHADAYERARPAWPEAAARWLVPEGAELVVELGAGTGKLTRAVSALGKRVVAVEPDPRMLAVLQRAGTRRGGGLGRGDSVRRRGGRRGRGRLQPPLVRARAGVAGDPSRPAAGRPFRLRLEPPRRPASGDRPHGGGGLRGAGAQAWAALAEPRLGGRADRVGPLRGRRASALRARPRAAARGARRPPALVLRGRGAGEDERRRVFGAVAEVLDSDPSVGDGATLRLPFVVAAYRASGSRSMSRRSRCGRG